MQVLLFKTTLPVYPPRGVTDGLGIISRAYKWKNIKGCT